MLVIFVRIDAAIKRNGHGGAKALFDLLEDGAAGKAEIKIEERNLPGFEIPGLAAFT
jgi:hypothetical protein